MLVAWAFAHTVAPSLQLSQPQLQPCALTEQVTLRASMYSEQVSEWSRGFGECWTFDCHHDSLLYCSRSLPLISTPLSADPPAAILPRSLHEI